MNNIAMMLDATNNIVNYVLIAVVVLMLIALPIMMNARNKRETQKVQEQTNSLKVGDKVLTTSGVYGTIVELKFDESQKVVVLETGGKTKSYLSVDAYAIYTVFKAEDKVKEVKSQIETKPKTEVKKDSTLVTEEKSVEIDMATGEKKTTNKKSTKKSK